MRVPALDGIRALAIAGVVAFHGGVSALPGGFFGVDTFFALSGFLITGLLLAEKESTGAISTAHFWARRARRLLPALFLVLVAVAAYVGLAGLAGDFPSLRLDGLATLFYVANWRDVATQTNYFALTAHPTPLLHTWSLAIEEQFYILWPLVVLLVLRGSRSSSRRRLALLGGAVVTAAAASAWWMHRAAAGADGTTRAYYGTDTRAQSLLIGVALAIGGSLWRSRPGVRRSPFPAWAPPSTLSSTGLAALALGLAGLAGTTFCFHSLDQSTRAIFSGDFALASGSAALLIASVTLHNSGPVARLLGLGPVAYVGRISYGIYLWHWPVVVFLTHARSGLTGWSLFAARVAVILAVSILSFHLVEQPIRRGALRRTPPLPTARRDRSSLPRLRHTSATSPRWQPEILALGAAVAVVLAVLLVTTSGAVPAIAAARTLPGRASAVHPTTTTAPLTPAQQQLADFYNSQSALASDTRVMMVGDSIALTLGMALSPYTAQNKIWLADEAVASCSVAVEGTFRIQYTDLAPPAFCGGDTASPRNWRALWLQWVEQFNPDVVVYVARNDVIDQYHDGTLEHVGEAGFDGYLTANLDEAVSVLGSRGAQVVLMTSPYYDSGEQPNGDPWAEDNPQRVNDLNAIFRQVAARHPGTVDLVDLNQLSCPGGSFTFTVDGQTIRTPDGVHFTDAAGEVLAPGILPTLYSLGRNHHLHSPGGSAPDPGAPAS